MGVSILQGIMDLKSRSAAGVPRAATSENCAFKVPEYLAEALELLPQAVVLVDSKGSIRLMNYWAEDFFGSRRSSLIGKSIEILTRGRGKSRSNSRTLGSGEITDRKIHDGNKFGW